MRTKSARSPVRFLDRTSSPVVITFALPSITTQLVSFIFPLFEYDLTNFFADVWRNFGYLVIFFIGFNLMQAWAVENLASESDSLESRFLFR